MKEGNVLWQERRLEEILYSNSDPAVKVQQIMRLGFDEAVASELVERHLIGTQATPYYESLSFDAEYDEALSERQSREDIHQTGQ